MLSLYTIRVLITEKRNDNWPVKHIPLDYQKVTGIVIANMQRPSQRKTDVLFHRTGVKWGIIFLVINDVIDCICYESDFT